MADTVLQWSGGKDSALALYRIQRESRRSVLALQTMINASTERTSWHGVRRETLAAQADALGLPLTCVPVAADVERYVEQTTAEFEQFRERGATYLAVGDIETEDPDMPRERAMAAAGLDPFYPLLGESPADLVAEFLDAGFRAKIVVANGTVLDESFVGRELSEPFLADLPDDADPGGERGEYHTFVYDGPIFDEPVPVTVGETITRTVAGDPHHYCDLKPE